MASDIVYCNKFSPVHVHKPVCILLQLNTYEIMALTVLRWSQMKLVNPVQGWEVLWMTWHL